MESGATQINILSHLHLYDSLDLKLVEQGGSNFVQSSLSTILICLSASLKRAQCPKMEHSSR